MKVQQAIELLTKYYESTDDIIIAWWDKATVEEYADKELTTDEWESIVEQLDDDDNMFQLANDTITDTAIHI